MSKMRDGYNVVVVSSGVSGDTMKLELLGLSPCSRADAKSPRGAG